jgi:GNAT superfamily N-acetyltransferase
MDFAVPHNIPILFQKVAGADWLRRIGHLRSLIWRHDGVRVPDFEGGNPDIWLDELDNTAHHWVALHGRRLVAAGRYTIHQTLAGVPDEHWFRRHSALAGPIASFNRLVVLQAYRRCGIGRRLDYLRCWNAIQQNCESIVAVAVGDHRRDSLAAIGFQLSFQFPVGHGLIVPERPLYAMIADAQSLVEQLPKVSTQIESSDYARMTVPLEIGSRRSI